jgi:hypothetical protein
MQIVIKEETAERLRRAAPRFGLVASDATEYAGPGLVSVTLSQTVAHEFEIQKFRAKVSADALVNRILKRAGV